MQDGVYVLLNFFHQFGVILDASLYVDAFVFQLDPHPPDVTFTSPSISVDFGTMQAITQVIYHRHYILVVILKAFCHLLILWVDVVVFGIEKLFLCTLVGKRHEFLIFEPTLNFIFCFHFS